MISTYTNLNMNLLTENHQQNRLGVVQAQVDINGDLPEKLTHNNNSWFVFGKYETEGHIINLLFHLMGMKLPLIGWVYQSVFTVYDETTGFYFAKDHLYPQMKIKTLQNKFFVQAPNGYMKGTADKMRIHIDESGI